MLETALNQKQEAQKLATDIIAGKRDGIDLGTEQGQHSKSFGGTPAHKELIKMIERGLNGAGYKVPVDGKFTPGDDVAKAIRRYQVNNHIQPTGLCGPQTIASLAKHNPELFKGLEGLVGKENLEGVRQVMSGECGTLTVNSGYYDQQAVLRTGARAINRIIGKLVGSDLGKYHYIGNETMKSLNQLNQEHGYVTDKAGQPSAIEQIGPKVMSKLIGTLAQEKTSFSPKDNLEPVLPSPLVR